MWPSILSIVINSCERQFKHCSDAFKWLPSIEFSTFETFKVMSLNAEHKVVYSPLDPTMTKAHKLASG